MIAVDTSALVAIAFREPDSDTFSRILAAEGALVATTSLVEVALALSRMEQQVVDGFIDGLIRDVDIRPTDFSFAMYRVAVDAFRRFGKGRGHPAQLNFGDCMSYALAKTRDVPLLYKGDDFARTDIRAAHAP